MNRANLALKPHRGKKKARTFGRERSTSDQFKEMKNQASEIELLLDGTIALQQARVIAMNLRDIELLYLVDMAAMRVCESINRHFNLNPNIGDSIRLN